jgi:hypothetical protein
MSVEPKRSRDGLVLWLLLLVAIGLVVLAVKRGSTAHHEPAHGPGAAGPDPLAALPAGPELVLSADLSRLGAALGRELFEMGGGQLLGLQKTCGFEPLLGLRRVVLAVPPRDDGQLSPDFALVAETSLRATDMVRCASAVIRQRGGEPVPSVQGKFSLVKDQKKPQGSVAVRSDGLFVLSGGRYLPQIVNKPEVATTPRGAAEVRSELHRALRQRLGDAALVLTLLPGGLLSVPELQAVAIGLDVGSDVELRGFVGCDSMAACQNVAGMLEQTKPAFARDRALAPLARVTLVQRDAQLELSGHLRRSELAPLLKALANR